MSIRIASWNCCLGLQNKTETVKIILQDYELDILFLQEAEIKNTTPINHLEIIGYTLELSPTYGQKNSRTCCYVKNNLKYTRDNACERNNVEIIVIKVFDTQIAGLYRPFLLPHHNNEADYMKDCSDIISSLNSKNILLLGDFNLDFKKVSDQSYARANTFQILENVLIEKTLVQLIKDHTWQRKYNETIKCSLLDHLYSNNINIVENIINEMQICGDHNLIAADVKIARTKYLDVNKKIINDWSKYSSERLINKLSDYDLDDLTHTNIDEHNSRLNKNSW